MSYGSDTWAKWVLNEDKSLPLLKAAWDAGIQTWDTADIYSNVCPAVASSNFQGVSEMVIRKAIEKYKIPRSKLVLLTKCFGTVHDDPYGGRTQTGCESTQEYVNKHGNALLQQSLFVGLSRKHIFEAVENSLERLGMDYVDVLQIHRYDPDTPREETMKALHGMWFKKPRLTIRFGSDGQSSLHWCLFDVCISIPGTSKRR